MDQDRDTALPGLIDVTEDQLGSARRPDREKVRRQALGDKGPFRTDPSRCDVWAGNTRDTTAVAQDVDSELKAAIEQVGQQVAVIARISPHDPERFEVVAGARRLTVIRQINEARKSRGEPPMQILMELRDLDDRAAFELMDGENRGRSELAPIEKARSYAFAIKNTYGTQPALAEALGLDKSNVNRTMKLLELPQSLLDVIDDVRTISAAQTSRFMADWSKPALQPTLKARIAEMSASGRIRASEAFKSLKKAVSEDSPPAEVAIIHDGQEIGLVRARSTGPIHIVLESQARQLGVTRAIEATRAALRSLVKGQA